MKAPNLLACEAPVRDLCHLYLAVDMKAQWPHAGSAAHLKTSFLKFHLTIQHQNRGFRRDWQRVNGWVPGVKCWFCGLAAAKKDLHCWNKDEAAIFAVVAYHGGWRRSCCCMSSSRKTKLVLLLSLVWYSKMPHRDLFVSQIDFSAARVLFFWVFNAETVR